MDQHNVHHYHHHHYHYHYTYPFPPGLPPHAPQNNEPLSQEAAGHDNDELSAENEQEENEEEYEEEIAEEHSEEGDTEDQQDPEDRSPSPVQQNEPLTKIDDPSRVGLAVFDDYFSLFNLDAQSAKAQARWADPQPNNEDHQEGPPRKKARTSALPECPEQPVSRGETSNSATQPQQSDHITIIDKALVIDTDKGFRVFNCDPSGPQVNICYRVPGPRNLWLGRIGDPTDEPLKSIKSLMGAERKPGFTPTTFILSPADAEGTISMILCSSSDRSYDDFERGEGRVICTGSDDEYMSALGRLVGFEVMRGHAYPVDKRI
ncbi:hypothetical protein FPCIR_10430 [Fusarium pseudocircinatum]|uniref:Uncharacterized protein n=1 Tax=Fusarium pseudocircinatum TaxID=56676 RepID=A0A8H5KYZ5_9HYPO|nr:hypothetical protein FPCIR_10430 [Fusarium pseudocircinatum]